MIKQGQYVATPNWFGKTEQKDDSQNIKVANAYTVPNTSNIILKTEGQGNGISGISSQNNVITVTKDTFSKQEIDILTTTDSDSPSDSNVFSAKRTLAEIQELIEQGGGGGSEDNFDDRYIRKDQTDTTNFLLNLLGGIILGDNGLKSNNFSTGILGSGFCLKNQDGDSYLEVDRMLVRKVATFVQLLIQELKHVGGQIILTPASMNCSKVEEFDSYYRCYFDNTDGEKTIEQQFVVGDLARAQTFNKTVNTYYWRAVVGIGDNYIDLSKDDCDAGSTIPNAGDEIVQLGNKTDSSRQAAIILSAYGNDAPYIKMYRGINSYLLDGKEFASFSRSQVMIIADQLKFSSGESIKDEIDNVSQKVDGTNQKVDEAISDLAENIQFVTELSKDLEAVKNQADGSIETWFYDPVPTLQNAPAINWITVEDKNLHLGDLYYDGNGKAYRFQMSGSEYIWQIITDSDITKALSDAKNAQDTADGKRRVFVVAPTNASEYDVGDLWVNATYGEYNNDLLRCKTAKKANEQWSISHWELASKYTDDTIANAAQEAADAAKQTADNAQQAANNAKENADIANALLADIANDNKLTAQEKQQTKKEWDIIVSEKSKNDASADSFKIDRTAYDNAYNTLYAYITPLLLDLTTTSNIVGSTFRNTFKNYYDSRTDLLNAISEKAKSIADAAQDTADNAAENALQAIEDAANAKVAADNAQQDATEAKERLDSWAEDGVISPTEKQSLKDEINRIDADKTQITDSYTKYSLGTPTNYNNAYTAYRNQLVTLTATSPETIPIPNDFASKQVTYYSERTNALIKISDAAKNYVNGLISGVQEQIDDIKQDVVEAITNAATAQEKANEAANRLNQWASDGVISPTEKLTLKQEQQKLIAEKDAIVADANKYSVNTTSYVTAFNNYNAELTYHTTSTPENITIRSSFATNQSAYYTAYKSINDAIATAAKKAISDVATDLNGYKSTVSSQFEATNDSIIAAVTSSKEYTNNAVSTVNNDLIQYKEDVSAQFSVLEGKISSKVSSDQITTIKTEILNTAASDATTKANNAKTSAISTAATDATNKANQAKNDAIATAATDATNKVNNIQIGGRNLLLNSNFEKFLSNWFTIGNTYNVSTLEKGIRITTKGGSADWGYLTQERNIIKENTNYVFTIKAKANRNRNIKFCLRRGDTGDLRHRSVISLSTEYTVQSSFIKITTDVSADLPTIILQDSTPIVDDWIEIEWTKFEEGNKATDWSPAPEDVTNDIETAKQDAITTAGTNADKKYATITTVSSMQTSITQLSNSISLKADKTEITSIQDDINTANNNISSLTTRVSNAEIKLQPDNIWLSVSSRVNTVLKDYTTTEQLSTSISQLNNKISLKAEKSEVTTISNNLNQANKDIDSLDSRLSSAEISLDPDNIWLSVSSRVETVLEDYATVEDVSTSINQLDYEISLKAEKTEVTTIKNNLNQTNSNLSALTTRVSKAEVALRPDNIWIGISSKVDTVLDDYSTTEEIKTGITVKENAISIFGKDVSLQGKITFSSLNSSLQSTINNKADSEDITTSVNSSKDDLAKKIGYASYADMVSAATAKNTIIDGGHIRTSLIEADALIVNTLSAVNADGINTLVNKDGMTISQDNNTLLNIFLQNQGGRFYGDINMFRYNQTSGMKDLAMAVTPNGVEIVSYKDSVTFADKTSLLLGQLRMVDENNAGILINKTGITLNYTVGTNTTTRYIVHYAKCIYSAYISSSGSVINKIGTNIPNSQGKPITFSVSKTATGRYKVTHNIGNTSYHVQITALSNRNLTVALIENIYSTYFEYSTTSFTNDIYTLMDAKVFIAVYYESPKLGTF